MPKGREKKKPVIHDDGEKCNYCGGPLTAEDVRKGYEHCSSECFENDTGLGDSEDEF